MRSGPTFSDEEQERAATNPRVTLEDAAAIRRLASHVGLVMARAQNSAEAKTRSEKLDTLNIRGVTREWNQLPDTNIATNVMFEPLDDSGSQAAVAPDFSLVASEINDVTRTMRSAGWDSGCLYNQETAEHPQLYFQHMIKAGDPTELANEVRAGLNVMRMRFAS